VIIWVIVIDYRLLRYIIIFIVIIDIYIYMILINKIMIVIIDVIMIPTWIVIYYQKRLFISDISDYDYWVLTVTIDVSLFFVDRLIGWL
jgi:hypothetical protein